MATLCALQLVRLTGVHDNHASSSSITIRRSEAGLKNELLHVSGLRIAPHHRVGSSLGRQTGCSSLWNHLRVSSRINHHVQSGRLPVLATSVLPSEEQVKKVASMFVDYGAQLIRRCFVFLLLLSWSLILCFWENDGMEVCTGASFLQPCSCEFKCVT